VVYVSYSNLVEAVTDHLGLPQHAKTCDCIQGASENLQGVCWTIGRAAEVVKFNRRAVAHWHSTGQIPIRHADAIAVALQRMPWEIWPEWNEWMDAQVAKSTRQDPNLFLVDVD